MNYRFLAALAWAVLATTPSAGREDKPKSNLFARAKVLSQNELSITISHSDWGKKAAFQFAADHCMKYHRIAVYQGGTAQFGPDTTSTWLCVVPPQEATGASGIPDNGSGAQSIQKPQ
jgi:hypothetical protein